MKTRLLGFGLGLLTFAASAVAAPVQLQHQTRLLDAAGQPVSGPVSLAVGLYDAEDADTPLWVRTWNVAVEAGYVSVLLDTSDTGEPVDSAWFGSDLWVGHSVDDGELPPRTRLVHAPRAAYAEDAGRAATADQAARVAVVPDGLQGVCTEAGRVAWDAADGALKVCDGDAWQDASPGRTVTVSDQGGGCTTERAGELAWRDGRLILCDADDWRAVQTQDLRPMIKASSSSYTIAQVRAAAVDGTQLPRRYGSTICGESYHICTYSEAQILKYTLPDHLIALNRNTYHRTHGNYTAGEIAGTTHPHNSLLGYSTGSWNGPSLSCPNDSGPMIYMYATTNRAIGQDWDGGCYRDDARPWACCLNRTY